jgi:predicted transcriptional regulator
MFNNNTEFEVRDKLTILMLIHELDTPITNEEITNLVLDASLLNYISMQHYLTELVELSMIEQIPQDQKQHYLLTENGRVALDFFKVRIPQHIQDKVMKIVVKYKEALPVETQVHANYTKISDDHYEVELSISENKVEMMSMKLMAVSDKHAEEICKKWHESSSTKYGEILNLLIAD